MRFAAVGLFCFMNRFLMAMSIDPESLEAGISSTNRK